MSNDVYKKLASTLDEMPNGFPSTDDGLEIRLLQNIFDPEEAEVFCNLKLNFETAEQIAERTGLPLEGLEEKLAVMMDKGQIFGINLDGIKFFKMLPWVFGIYEYQLPHMERELAEMCDE